MDNKQAIKVLRNIVEYWTYRPTEVEAAELAIQALEKQIPKRVVFGKNAKFPFGKCPCCDYEFNSELQSEYCIKRCINCGQALKWEE